MAGACPGFPITFAWEDSALALSHGEVWGWASVLTLCLAPGRPRMPMPLCSSLKSAAVCYCLAHPCMGNADALQWHPYGLAEPSEEPGLLMPPHLLGPCMLLLGHVGSSLAGCAGGGVRVPADAQLSLACFTLHWLLCTCTKLPTACSKCQDLGPLPKLLPSILQFQTWIPLPTALSTLII